MSRRIDLRRAERPPTSAEADAFVPEGQRYVFEQGAAYAIAAQVPWFVPKGLIGRWAARNGFGDVRFWSVRDPRAPFRPPLGVRPHNTLVAVRRRGPTSTFGLPDPEIVWVARVG